MTSCDWIFKGSTTPNWIFKRFQICLQHPTVWFSIVNSVIYCVTVCCDHKANRAEDPPTPVVMLPSRFPGAPRAQRTEWMEGCGSWSPSLCKELNVSMHVTLHCQQVAKQNPGHDAWGPKQATAILQLAKLMQILEGLPVSIFADIEQRIALCQLQWIEINLVEINLFLLPRPVKHKCRLNWHAAQLSSTAWSKQKKCVGAASL